MALLTEGIEAAGREAELAAALAAVREAATLCRAVQDGIVPEVLEKEDRSPVTVADFGSQALVCRALGEAFPGDPIVAEEGSAALRAPGGSPLLGRLVERVSEVRPGAGEDEVLEWIDRGGGRPGPRFWTLDPIDGTKGFLRRDQYAVSLALIEEGEIVVAALACPRLHEGPGSNGRVGVALCAARGAGSHQMPLDDGPARRLSVSPQEDPAGLRFCESVEKAHSSHGDAARIAERLGIVASPARIDSQAKYAVVARGDAEAYLRLPRSAEYREKIWDHAGGALVVREAGGEVSDVLGRPLDFTRGSTLAANLGVVVSNGRLHGPLIRAMGELGIGRFGEEEAQR